MADIFMSYARSDKARVEPIAKALQGRGFDVFWDMEATPDALAGAIAHAKAVIAVAPGRA